ncbi:MAG: DNA-directed RNA polymerase subunit beta [Dehalococcoidia bacterium]|nr:DNA-directed RNA polymerase subunit beta [Dehalococcoidia bacterium]
MKSYAKIPDVLELPNLIQVQLQSFRWFKEEGLGELLSEISPISDFTGNRMEMRFLKHDFKDPKYSEAECRERDATYSAPLNVIVELTIKETGEKVEQPIFMGDFPLMTEKGTFIINGAERVVVSQLVRSPGVYFTIEEEPTSGRALGFAKLIPSRGTWLEFETNNKNILSVKVDRKRKILLTTLLRALGYSSNEDLLYLLNDIDGGESYLLPTLEKDPCKTREDALLELYKRLRPGDPPTQENAQSLVNALFFTPRRYDLGRVGRHKVDKRLQVYGDVAKETAMFLRTVNMPEETRELQDRLDEAANRNDEAGLDIIKKLRTMVSDPAVQERLNEAIVRLSSRILTRDDLSRIVKGLVLINQGHGVPDDIDHLGNRRIRAVGELIQNQFRVGLLRMERVIRERMTITDPQQATPSALINIRPVVAAMKEFFGGSQLSQFMDQTNPLAELTHKRRLSALGPGGLSRERAGFDVRDVHHSHYGRICPIETPEGPNIGLIGSLATFGRINEFGFIETPYRKVINSLPNTDSALIGHTLRDAVADSKETVIGEAGQDITSEIFTKLSALQARKIKIKPFVSKEIEYLSADKEENYIIAQANSSMNSRGHLLDARVEARHGERFMEETPDNLDYMDASPKQIVSVATALIPFLEHDDANRALMGANMQRQAVPLLRPEMPLVGTGMERRAAMDSGQAIFSPVDGVIARVSSSEIVVVDETGKTYSRTLMKFLRSNQGTCLTQRAIVREGDVVKKGDPIADSASTDDGNIALGQNVLCAFMSWEGCNYEDAIVISESMVREDKFTSIHIEKHEIDARDTKLGPEEITRDIPNVGEESLRDLDEFGIIRTGAEVGPGDILVGKITPKGETELTAEEKLLRAIFGEKAREVKDTSLRVPHGERGKIIDVRVFSRDNNDELPPGVNKLVRVSIAQLRKISEGDKMAGRHGNKGVIARILPVEDMPRMSNGTPVDIILNPIGVPSRMNVGQVLEAHLGFAAEALGFKVLSPVFDGATEDDIQDALAKSWMIEQSCAGLPGNQLDRMSIESKIDNAKAWLDQQGYDGDAAFLEGNVGPAKQSALRIWMKQNGAELDIAATADLDALAYQLHREKNISPPTYGKTILYDGRTGEAFDQPTTVGRKYMLKLVHLVEDKIHARSTGPYSLITQQPLGGKAQFGGQRFGEMEVWALEAYGAAHILQELLTVKSDDVLGRVKTYESIVKGEDIVEPGVPESFKVLVKELQSLGLTIEALNEDEERVPMIEDTGMEIPELGIDLTGMEKGEF